MNGKRHSYTRPAEVVLPYAFVAIALVVGAAVIPGFLSLGHLKSMSATASYIGIIAIGQTFVLLLGGIDLSIPYMINLAAVLVTGLEISGFSSASDLVIALLAGVSAGLLNGIGVALLDISPLVMTLGMNSVLEGLTLLYTNGSPRGSAPGFIATLSTGAVGVPYVVLLWILLIVVVTIVLVFTTFGRRIYSVGSNAKASALCGLPVKWTIVVAYAISGFSAALGGVLLVGYSGAAYIGMGNNYLLLSVAVVVIGGTSILGGKGSYLQTVAGSLLLTVILAALVVINVSQAGQDMLYGVVILLMAFFSQKFISVEGRALKSIPDAAHAFKGWLASGQKQDSGDRRVFEDRKGNYKNVKSRSH